jgi:hypothetical protein
MGDRVLTSMVSVAIAAAVLAAIATQTSAQAALRTQWGEPDLEGTWTEEFDTPLQRPARYPNREFFTEAQRQELDRRRAVYYGDDARQQRWSVFDDGVMYNTTFLTIKRASPRTSMIVDPPKWGLPPQTPEAQRAAAADREFFLALMQSTDACKNKEPVCAGGKYDPTPSPRFSEAPPRYHAVNNARLNRSDRPEDDGLQDRCWRASARPESESPSGRSAPAGGS